MIVWEKARKDKSTLARLTELNRMSTAELKEKWRELYGQEPPEFKRQLLLRRLAYRIQELAHGGLDAQTNAKMTKLLERAGYDEMGRKPDQSRQLPYQTPGMVFVREWHDRKHEVTLLDDGKFEYDGIPYKSLTAIATKITGTKRNGPKFFGLRDRGNP